MPTDSEEYPLKIVDFGLAKLFELGDVDQSATQLAEGLQKFERKRKSLSGKLMARLRQPRIAIPAGVALLALIVLGAWLVVGSTRARWAISKRVLLVPN
jgi:hypothetical protein